MAHATYSIAACKLTALAILTALMLAVPRMAWGETGKEAEQEGEDTYGTGAPLYFLELLHRVGSEARRHSSPPRGQEPEATPQRTPASEPPPSELKYDSIRFNEFKPRNESA
jgi:hypothetical protein